MAQMQRPKINILRIPVCHKVLGGPNVYFAAWLLDYSYVYDQHQIENNIGKRKSGIQNQAITYFRKWLEKYRATIFEDRIAHRRNS